LPLIVGMTIFCSTDGALHNTLVLVFLSLTSRFERLENYLTLTSLLLLITIIIGLFFPAQCPGKFLHPINQNFYDSSFSHLEMLRSGQMKSIDLSKIQGLICIPSFHAVSAFLFCWSLRRTILIYFIFPLNVLMLFATPIFGGHYLVDVLSGLLLAGAAAFVFAKTGKRIRPIRFASSNTQAIAVCVNAQAGTK
jgi:PAP2 superfamily